MNPGDPRPLLDRHAARILARWREQLRALPPSSALAAPELLAPLMAPALTRVRQETTRVEPATAQAPEAVNCRCGLNPLVTFYLTGECATFDVLWGQADAIAPLTHTVREDVCRRIRNAWRRVAADEVALFCSVCRRGAALEAEEEKHVASAATGAGSHAPQERVHAHAAVRAALPPCGHVAVATAVAAPASASAADSSASVSTG